MQWFCNLWLLGILLVIVLRLNQSLKLAERILSVYPHQIAQAQLQHSSLSTVNTPLLASHRQCERRPLSVVPNIHADRSSTQTACDLNISILHHPEHLQVACQKNETIFSVAWQVEPDQHPEFNANKESVEGLDAFPSAWTPWKHCWLGHRNTATLSGADGTKPRRWFSTDQ